MAGIVWTQAFYAGALGALSASALVAGALLDGIPESLVIDCPPLPLKLLSHPPVTIPGILHHNLFNAVAQIGLLKLP